MDVGSQVITLSSHALHLWLRAAASACGIDDAPAGSPGRGRHDSAVAQSAGGRWPPGASSERARGGSSEAWLLPTSKTCSMRWRAQWAPGTSDYGDRKSVV